MKRYSITVNGNAYDVSVEEIDAGAEAPVAAAPAAPKAAKPAAPKAAPAGAQGGVKVEAPMPGTVVDVKRKVGDKVKNGDDIVIVEVQSGTRIIRLRFFRFFLDRNNIAVIIEFKYIVEAQVRVSVTRVIEHLHVHSFNEFPLLFRKDDRQLAIAVLLPLEEARIETVVSDI